MDVDYRVLDVAGEVGDATATAGLTQVVVDPAQQNLLRRQLHQVLQRLVVLQQRRQAGLVVEVDQCEQTDLQPTPHSPAVYT